MLNPIRLLAPFFRMVHLLVAFAFLQGSAPILAAPTDSTPPPVPTSFAFTLPAATRIVVVTRDERGKTVPLAQLEVQLLKNGRIAFSHGIITNERGRFPEATGLEHLSFPPGSYLLKAEPCSQWKLISARFLPAQKTGSALTIEATVRQLSYFRIEGSALTTKGQPLMGVEVVAQIKNPLGETGVYQTTTDTQGQFSLWTSHAPQSLFWRVNRSGYTLISSGMKVTDMVSFQPHLTKTYGIWRADRFIFEWNETDPASKTRSSGAEAIPAP